jgi:excinuclease ABC subunit C
LRRLLADKSSLRARFEALRAALRLEAMPARVECFDVSHTRGEAPVAACIVFDLDGPVKSDYRRFNIEGVGPGDDYGALRQALERRYRRLKEGEGKLPDLLLIDGGKGQVGIACDVLEELQVEGVRLVGVAKGRERRAGKEQLFLSGSRRPTILPADSAALHLIQQIRDEAHRFAITGHRLRRGKARTESRLERIPGIGDKRRQLLLRNFGGLREVARAGVDDLVRVPGISRELAQRIYDIFHVQEP